MRVVEVWYSYATVNAHIASENITQCIDLLYLFKQRKKDGNEWKSAPPRVDCESLESQTSHTSCSRAYDEVVYLLLCPSPNNCQWEYLVLVDFSDTLLCIFFKLRAHAVFIRRQIEWLHEFWGKVSMTHFPRHWARGLAFAIGHFAEFHNECNGLLIEWKFSWSVSCLLSSLP